MAETQEETSGSDCPASNSQPEAHSRNVHDSEGGGDDGVAGDLHSLSILTACACSCGLIKYVLEITMHKVL